MKRFTRVALAATAVAIPVGIFAAAGSAAFAAAPNTPVKFTGSITCTTKGSITINPPIDDSTQTSKVTFTGKLSACSGNTSEKGVTISGGSFRDVQTITGSCSTLTSGLPSGTLKVTYSASGGTVTPSKVAFSGVGVTATSSTVSFVIPNSGGTTTTTGSFANSSSGSKASVTLDQSPSTLLGECTTTGVSKLTFTGKLGKSSITVG